MNNLFDLISVYATFWLALCSWSTKMDLCKHFYVKRQKQNNKTHVSKWFMQWVGFCVLVGHNVIFNATTRWWQSKGFKGSTGFSHIVSIYWPLRCWTSRTMNIKDHYYRAGDNHIYSMHWPVERCYDPTSATVSPTALQSTSTFSVSASLFVARVKVTFCVTSLWCFPDGFCGHCNTEANCGSFS